MKGRSLFLTPMPALGVATSVWSRVSLEVRLLWNGENWAEIWRKYLGSSILGRRNSRTKGTEVRRGVLEESQEASWLGHNEGGAEWWVKPSDTGKSQVLQAISRSMDFLLGKADTMNYKQRVIECDLCFGKSLLISSDENERQEKSRSRRSMGLSNRKGDWPIAWELYAMRDSTCCNGIKDDAGFRLEQIK